MVFKIWFIKELMATLRIFKRPSGLNFPEAYTKRNLGDIGENISFIKKIECEIQGYKKYNVGRYFEKEYKISKPSETGLIEETIKRPATLFCHVYIPETEEDEGIYLVGPNSELLYPEILSFGEIKKINTRNIDMEKLEKRSFSSGVINLIGHKYNQANNTISYTVRKIDGVPFNDQDPDFVSCEETEKEVLEVRLTMNESQYYFHVYSDGKITRKGPDEIGSSPFGLLRAVFDIILQETESQ